MDNLFFTLSKTLWLFIEPDNLIIISLLLVVILFLVKKDKIAKKALYSLSFLVIFIAVFPVGSWLLYPLETHFNAKPKLPEQVDGIILLGGSINTSTSNAWNKPQTNEFAGRIFEFVSLMHLYPNAKAVFSGGQASLINQYPSEAFFAEQLLNKMGIKENKVIYENKARNTNENVKLMKQLLTPAKNETWVVITTAWHLPRSLGIFCKQGWSVIPYPADFHSNPDELLTPTLGLPRHLSQLNNAVREWIGLLAYYITGKTTELLPLQC
ncbi:MAG: YdcF family protein [Gammaproteobacteria bacterium]|nr:YdcF family protein [Gammaproteobacteria bacterium]